MPDGFGGGAEGAGGGSQGMGGLGGNGNGGGRGANDGNEGESQAAQAQAAAQAAAQAQAAANASAQADRESADQAARERATAAAAAAEAQRAAEAQQAAAASLMGGAVENPALSFLSGVSLSNNQEAALAKTEQVNALREQANEKLASYYGKDANKYPTTADKDPNAVVAVYKDLMGPLTKQTMMLGGGKNNPEGREVSVDVPQNAFVDTFGRSPTYAEAKALQAAGLGNITGVNANNLTGTNLPVQGVEGLTYNEPGQTADSIVAVTDFKNYVGPILRAAAMFIPGMSLALTLNDMYTGKITAGEVASSVLLSLLAKNLGIPVGVVNNALNGNPGGMLSSALVGQINSYASKELNTNPIFTGILGKESGLYGEIGKSTSGLNQNWGTTKTISDAFNTGLRNMGVTIGTGVPDGSAGQQVNTGTTTQDALEHYLNSNNGGPSNAPQQQAPAPAAPVKAPAAVGNTSKAPSSLDALGAAAFGLTGALGLGSSGSTTPTGNTASLSSVAPLSLASTFQTKVIPNQPKFQGALEEFNQLQQSKDPNAVQYALSDQDPRGNDMTPYTYGVDRPIGDILNPQDVAMQDVGYSPDGVPDYMKTGIQAASGGAMTGTRYGKYASGGLSTPLMAAGGKMRVDFRHGDAVTGDGDGQSDDIPAMLADGEFVFPADVVAAIGNGSTKAGSDKLYDMMHAIRAHVRSAKPKDLPPEIKSPLDFLKNTKRQGAKHG